MSNLEILNHLNHIRFRNAVTHADLDSIKEEVGCAADQEELVNMKMEFGAIGQRTTALIFSAKHDEPEIVRYLLTVQGIDVNLVDTFGRSALHWAARSSSKDIVKMLVKIPNIQLEMEDMNGASAQDVADFEISCIIQTAIIANLKKKLVEDVKTEDIVKEMPFYGKRKLNATLETFRAKKRKNMEEAEKLDEAIHEAEECIKNADPVATLQDAKNDFECPICFEDMKPPTEIWLCDSGHTLCGNCKTNPLIKNCPTCSKDIRVRNRAMENLYPALF